jgi:uncharacterized protein (TIGR02145 family)
MNPKKQSLVLAALGLAGFTFLSSCSGEAAESAVSALEAAEKESPTCVVQANTDGTAVFDVLCDGVTVGHLSNGKDGAAGVAGATGAAGTSCTMTALADGTGYTATCGGVEVGKVLHGTNGLNGTNGTNGVDGAGCAVATVETGLQVTCGTAAPVVVQNGKDGKDGLDCTGEEVAPDATYPMGGIRISCGGKEVGVIENGKDGANAENPVCTGEPMEASDEYPAGGIRITCGGEELGVVASAAKSSSSSVETEAESVRRAKPVASAAATETPNILASWFDNKYEGGITNWYLIKAGHVENVLVKEANYFQYSGVGTTGFSMTETQTKSTTDFLSETISESLVTTNEESSNTSSEAGGSVTIEAGYDGVLFEASASVEGHYSKTTAAGKTFSETVGSAKDKTKSLETSVSTTIETTVTRTFTPGENLAGYYRDAWYVTSDVYFIVQTDAGNSKLLWFEVLSIPRQNVMQASEYSADNIFDNSPVNGTEISLADDFYKRLPLPGCLQPNKKRVDVIDGMTCQEDGKITSSFRPNRNNDAPVYNMVQIGNQIWMAEDLRYIIADGTGSWCADGDPDNDPRTCSYRLYDWATAMGIDSKYNNESYPKATESYKTQGICPNGWHLPSDDEWDELMMTVNPECTANADCAGAGTLLKAADEWKSSSVPSGTDAYGFSALPGGFYDEGHFLGVGYNNTWWSASENNASNAYERMMYNSNESVDQRSDSKISGFSVRCVKDQPSE